MSPGLLFPRTFTFILGPSSLCLNKHHRIVLFVCKRSPVMHLLWAAEIPSYPGLLAHWRCTSGKYCLLFKPSGQLYAAGRGSCYSDLWYLLGEPCTLVQVYPEGVLENPFTLPGWVPFRAAWWHLRWTMCLNFWVWAWRGEAPFVVYSLLITSDTQLPLSKELRSWLILQGLQFAMDSLMLSFKCSVIEKNYPWRGHCLRKWNC